MDDFEFSMKNIPPVKYVLYENENQMISGCFESIDDRMKSRMERVLNYHVTTGDDFHRI